MNMADDALAGWNGSCKFMFDRMAGFIPRNRRVILCALPAIAVHCVGTRVHCGSVIRVDNMTGSAPAAAIIPRMVIGSRKRKNRIEQTSLLQSQKHGIS